MLEGVVIRNKVHKEMLHTKYKSSTPSSLREKKMKMGFFVPTCIFQLLTPGAWPKGYYMNKLDRGSQGDA